MPSAYSNQIWLTYLIYLQYMIEQVLNSSSNISTAAKTNEHSKICQH